MHAISFKSHLRANEDNNIITIIVFHDIAVCCFCFRIINENLLGHGVVLQFLDSELGPSMLQSLPPFAGAGAVHDLVFCCIPPPQVALHGEYSPHGVYPPSTANQIGTLDQILKFIHSFFHVFNIYLTISTLFRRCLFSRF